MVLLLNGRRANSIVDLEKENIVKLPSKLNLKVNKKLVTT